jgi:hypothetical protein
MQRGLRCGVPVTLGRLFIVARRVPARRRKVFLFIKLFNTECLFLYPLKRIDTMKKHIYLGSISCRWVPVHRR